MKGRFTGGGSRLGKPNKHPKAFRDKLRAYCARLGIDPFEYMADLIANTELVPIGVDAEGQPVLAPLVPVQVKFNCAKELASYLEPRMRTLEVTGHPDHPLHFMVQVKTTLAQAFELAYGAPPVNGHATPRRLPAPRG